MTAAAILDFKNLDSLTVGRVKSSVVTVSETDTETRFFAKTVRRRNLGFSTIIDGFWAHLHAKII